MSEQGQKGGNIIIKRVKKVAGGAHGGSWKVAYADLVTAMMAFFLLMWLLNMVPQTKKEELAAYFNDFSIFSNPGPSAQPMVTGGMGPPGALVGSQDERPDVAVDRGGKEPAGGQGKEGDKAGAAEKAANKALEREVEAQLQKIAPDLAGQVAVTEEQGKVRIEIMDKSDRPLFDLGGVNLTADAKRILSAVTAAIRADNVKVGIEGHTDAYRYSGTYTNWDLSAGRALSARRQMIQDGLPPENVAQVAGYADTRPYVAGDPYNAKNRRISLLLYREPKPGETPADDASKAKPQPAPKKPPSVGEELERQIDNLYDKSTEGQF